MKIAIVSVHNNELNIENTIKILLSLELERIVLVISGLKDKTIQKILTLISPKIHILFFPQYLGVDIPKAIGAFYAYNKNAEVTIFIDKCTDPVLKENITELMQGIEKKGLDLALTSCYPALVPQSHLAKLAIHMQEKFHKELDIFKKIYHASPSISPFAVSRKFLENIPLQTLAIPPISVLMAAKNNLQIELATCIPYHRLKGVSSHNLDSALMAKTVIGDYVEALNLIHGLARVRQYNKTVYIGYDAGRRWDMLVKYVPDPD